MKLTLFLFLFVVALSADYPKIKKRSDISGTDVASAESLVISVYHDGSFLYSSLGNGWVKKLNPTTGAEISSFQPHGNGFAALGMIADATSFYTRGKNIETNSGTIKKWKKTILNSFVSQVNDPSSALDRTFSTHENSGDPQGMALNGNDLYCLLNDGTIYKWNAATGAKLATFNVSSSLTNARALAFSNNFLYAGSGSGLILKIDANNGNIVAQYQKDYNFISSLAVNGRYLFAGSGNDAFMWDINAGTMDSSLNRKVSVTPIVIFTGHTAGVTAVNYLNGYLFTASDDNTIAQWDMTGSVVNRYTGNTAGVKFLSANGLNLYSGSNDGKVKKWTINLPFPIDFGNSGHIVISMISDGAYLYSGAYDGFVTKWDKGMSLPITSFKAHFAAVSAVYSDATYLYTASYDKTIKMWRKVYLDPYNPAKALARIIRGPKDAIRSIYVKNTVLYAGTFEQKVHKFNIMNGALLTSYPTLSGKVYSIAMDPNGQLFAGLTDGTIAQIDTISGNIVASYLGHTKTVNSITINGNFLFSGSWDTTAKMWDTSSGKVTNGKRIATNLDVLTNFTGGHADFIKDIAFKDGYLYTASFDKTISQWDTMGNLIAKYTGHTDGVMTILIDGTTLYSGSYDYRIKKWQTYTPPTSDLSLTNDFSVSIIVNVKSSSISSYSLLTSPNLNITIPGGSLATRVYYQTTGGIYYYDNAPLVLNTPTNVTLLATGTQFFVLNNQTVISQWTLTTGETRIYTLSSFKAILNSKTPNVAVSNLKSFNFNPTLDIASKPVILTDEIAITKNLLGFINNIPLNYILKFSLKPNSAISGYGGILQASKSGDVCNADSRKPYIYFSPNSTQLHVAWYGFVKPLPAISLNQYTDITIAAKDFNLWVFYNSALVAYEDTTGFARSSGPAFLYAGYPSDTNADAFIKNVALISDVTSPIADSGWPGLSNSVINTKKDLITAPVTLSTTNVFLGNLTLPDDYVLNLVITPQGIVSGYSQIFQATKTNNFCCDVGSRVPYIGFTPDSTSLEIRFGTSLDGNWGLVTPAIPIGYPTNVTLVQKGLEVYVLFNSSIVYNAIADSARPLGPSFVYLGSPWSYMSRANAVVEKATVTPYTTSVDVPGLSFQPIDLNMGETVSLYDDAGILSAKTVGSVNFTSDYQLSFTFTLNELVGWNTTIFSSDFLQVSIPSSSSYLQILYKVGTSILTRSCSVNLDLNAPTSVVLNANGGNITLFYNSTEVGKWELDVGTSRASGVSLAYLGNMNGLLTNALIEDIILSSS